jgi:hypothetical protein
MLEKIAKKWRSPVFKIPRNRVFSVDSPSDFHAKTREMIENADKKLVISALYFDSKGEKSEILMNAVRGKIGKFIILGEKLWLFWGFFRVCFFCDEFFLKIQKKNKKTKITKKVQKKKTHFRLIFHKNRSNLHQKHKKNS